MYVSESVGFYREGKILCIRWHYGSLKKTYYSAYGSQRSIQTWLPWGKKTLAAEVQTWSLTSAVSAV